MLEVEVQAHSQKFWFAENLSKIPENLGINGAQPCFTSKNGTHGLRKNTWRPFLGGHTKKKSSWSFWEKICRKNCTKNFSGKFGEIRAKILRTPKDLPAPTPMMKRHLCLHCPPFKRAEGKMLLPCLHSPGSLYISFYTLFTRCCRLQCVTEMNINHISGLLRAVHTYKTIRQHAKTGSRTHSMLCQGSSQLQKDKAARMSRWIAVNQNLCGWDGGHLGLTI